MMIIEFTYQIVLLLIKVNTSKNVLLQKSWRSNKIPKIYSTPCYSRPVAVAASTSQTIGKVMEVIIDHLRITISSETHYGQHLRNSGGTQIFRIH